MACCDVNVVVALLRADHVHHDEARAAVEACARDDVDIALPDFVLASVVRIVTSNRVFPDPNEPTVVLDALSQLLQPPGRLLVGSPRTWRTFERLVRSLALRGNDVPDAALAAVCLDNRLELLTFDRGFARFPGLRWRIPAGT